MIETKARNSRKTEAFLSNLEKARLKFLIFTKKHSTRGRARERCLSYALGSFRFLGGGMRGMYC